VTDLAVLRAPRKQDRPETRHIDREALALYVHWPFCVSKCPYCDFNSHVRDAVDQELWRTSLIADLAHEAAKTAGRRLGSIFFGGGTPSLMPPSTVAAIIEAAAQYWGFDEAIEITLEANPSSVEAARFHDLALAGVNRVSLGMQSLSDEALRFLGRAHDVVEGLAALDTALDNFARVSFDLIYALPGQTRDAWGAELEQALAYGTGHLSLYQLTIEPGTRFATMAAKGELPPVDPDHAATLYELTRALTEEAGRPAYEVSNHARPGEESRHNLTYWRYQDYCGVGPGAHGRRLGAATQRHRKPENWLSAVARAGHGIAEESALDGREKMVEAMLMGLRLREGVDLDVIGRLDTGTLSGLVNEPAVSRLERAGLLARDASNLRTTPAGMLLLDSLLREILI
jgi:oxygen-independent coproporphyrinogen-3 oxidase